ncbi:Beta-propeller repeat containing protein [Halorhabdus sp. SVX81]|uniref:FG-GAP repeat protein n=1 Tax=Halorhabdus sp. SVX81 TaxID=2978283 RepID=UPI0023DA7285|nr:FG-GAP repeat protein [Halorhabdus sp. SVX81]WEL17748.1 Beta-propeller repeat containing protein [Halorhabdus sp. SVX81]
MNPSRRTALKLVGTASLTAVAGCSGIGAPGQSFGNRRTLWPDDGNADDLFGNEVAVSRDGSTILVSAYQADTSSGTETGAVYVFERENGSWTQAETLVPDASRDIHSFGAGVALSAGGTTAVVGCGFDERREMQISGAVYVFERVDGEWSQGARLTEDVADDATDRSVAFANALGESVAVSADGGTVLAGAPYHAFSTTSGGPPVSVGSAVDDVVASVNDSIGPTPGAAFVFERSGGEWHQAATFAPEERWGPDHVGSAVALTGDGSKAFVASQGGGSVTVFERVEESWAEASTLPIDDDTFLYRDGVIGISSDGTMAVVGDYGGPASVFEWVDGEWTRSATLSPGQTDNPGKNAHVALSADGERALIVRPSTERKNVVEAVTRSGGSWPRGAVLDAGGGRSDGRFGRSLALAGDGTTAVVGADRAATENGIPTGAAFVFE